MKTDKLIAYYERGGPCMDYNDECRHRASGCPCTDTAQHLRKLEAVRDTGMRFVRTSEPEDWVAFNEALAACGDES